MDLIVKLFIIMIGTEVAGTALAGGFYGWYIGTRCMGIQSNSVIITGAYIGIALGLWYSYARGTIRGLIRYLYTYNR